MPTEAQRAYQRAYRAAHRETRNANERKWRAEHREELKAYQRAYRAEHREELNAASRKRAAEHPDRRKAIQRKYRATHHEELTAAGRERARAYRAENPERVRAVNRAYVSTDAGYAMGRAGVSRTAARNRGAVIDPELTSAILCQILRDGENCAWCRNSVPLRERMIDHRRAICFGGEHTADNVQILCRSCHKQKSKAERSLARKLRNGITKADFALVA